MFKPIDNISLIIFRMIFGFLITFECINFIVSGFVFEHLISPAYLFPHIGFEWLSVIQGYVWYVYFAVMGFFAFNIMIGNWYRLSTVLVTILWAGFYFSQKTMYNNHYYLLMIVSFLLIFLPANAYYSVDAKRNPTIFSLTMPAWVKWLMIVQISIVYFYATLAKFYPDWLDGTFTKILYSRVSGRPFLQEIFSQPWFYISIAYLGILYDALIVPFLLFKQTRTIALVASLIFHLSNSLALPIGIFPYFALSFSLFFYPPETLKQFVFKNKPAVTEPKIIRSVKIPPLGAWGLSLFLLLQFALPLRHYFIKGDVFWTEEGHRLSWRMMLREKTGNIAIKVVNYSKNTLENYDLDKNLSKNQLKQIATKPDFIWQYCQEIKQQYEPDSVAIFVDCKCSINQKTPQTLINPSVDMAKARWNYFAHNDWIVLH